MTGFFYCPPELELAERCYLQENLKYETDRMDMDTHRFFN